MVLLKVRRTAVSGHSDCGFYPITLPPAPSVLTVAWLCLLSPLEGRDPQKKKLDKARRTDQILMIWDSVVLDNMCYLIFRNISLFEQLRLFKHGSAPCGLKMYAG